MPCCLNNTTIVAEHGDLLSFEIGSLRTLDINNIVFLLLSLAFEMPKSATDQLCGQQGFSPNTQRMDCPVVTSFRRPHQSECY